MPLKIQTRVSARSLLPELERLFELSAQKLLRIERSWDPARGTPVFTRRGVYTSRGWTEWTQGFQFGSALLQFDATGDGRFLEIGRARTRQLMAGHVSHVGVHDHGFNNVSTYGNLLRLMREGKIPEDDREREFYELALKVSGAVQAARWTCIAPPGPSDNRTPAPGPDGDGRAERGFIYSFNGPHSLFIDTMRSLRSLALAHRLGHALMGERDRRISLLERLVAHADTTARFNIYYGEGRDAYDLPGRTAHESLFNRNDGSYRCPNSQQGFSPFTTWTRGLAWAICGFAEELEFLRSLPAADLERFGGLRTVEALFEKPARATAEFYIANTPVCGIPLWDTGAPQLHRLGDYLNRRADPFNPWEPVDSSAAAIAAQGFLRLGNYFLGKGDAEKGGRYRQAGLTVARNLFDDPYLSVNPKHQGLLLHSIYHRPNGWDYVAPNQKIPNGESSMWGDYHARELALMLLREAGGEPYLAFFGPFDGGPTPGLMETANER